MSTLASIYRHSLALLTDLYQLTMAYGYWKLGIADRETVFTLNFRHNPFHGGYSVACGLHDAIAYVQGLRFDADDQAYLAGLNGNDGKPLFEPAFLQYLGNLQFSCDIDAIPEGTVVFAGEPLVRVRGPMLQAQILETPLLNLLNFQTLVATKAARVCWAARGDPVLEFGLRRAQGVDGGLSASRSAFVGGCSATSNLLAGKLFGIPVRGTHAHSWVMSFDTELEAFEAYASAMPNNCVFLVDTYNTVQGVRHAVEIGKKLRAQGHEMLGVRLDSGDLAYLSIAARKILDEGGFPKVAIVASNDLDETIIASLKEQQGAKISIWGVGTKLVTAYDQPALGGVYKLSAQRGPGGEWEYKVKLSEQSVKISTPGILNVRRFRHGNEYIADAIYDENTPIAQPVQLVDPADPTRRKTIEADTPYEDLLLPIFRQGKLVYALPDLPSIQHRAREQMGRFYPGVMRFINPHAYPVGLERGLYDVRTALILKTRESAGK